MLSMLIVLTHHCTFTHVFSLRSLSTRALACDTRKGRMRCLPPLLLIGIGVDFMEELTLEVVIGLGGMATGRYND